MKVLFVCNQNLNRSKTAEHVFRDKFETQSAGLYNENPISTEQLDWADLVVVMEEEQRKEIAARFPEIYTQKKIVNLDIPDTYFFGDEKLRKILIEKMGRIF